MSMDRKKYVFEPWGYKNIYWILSFLDFQGRAVIWHETNHSNFALGTYCSTRKEDSPAHIFTYCILSVFFKYRNIRIPFFDVRTSFI